MIGAWLTEFWEEDRVENGSRSVGHGYPLAVSLKTGCVIFAHTQAESIWRPIHSNS